MLVTAQGTASGGADPAGTDPHHCHVTSCRRVFIILVPGHSITTARWLPTLRGREGESWGKGTVGWERTVSSSCLTAQHFCTTRCCELHRSGRTGLSTCWDGWAGHRQGRAKPGEHAPGKPACWAFLGWACLSASLRTIRKQKSR